ncbi:glycosyltransferase [bacterium]|nr:glycosyltransferase [bacterium]
MTSWAILTGEYPPQPGGVSDYTCLIARGLAAAGDRVVVFAPPCHESERPDEGVNVVRLPDHFARLGRSLAIRELKELSPDRVLVQYVPHAFGMKAMNWPFTAWVAREVRKIAPIWVMFHEVAFPFVRRPLRHNIVAVANRLMARQLVKNVSRTFVSIPTWGDLLHKIAGPSVIAEWLPIPSTLESAVDGQAVTDLRKSLGTSNTVIGHFGTYGSPIVQWLEPAILSLLRKSADRTVLLIGRNGEAFRETLIKNHPDLSEQIVATGGVSIASASWHIAACDLLLQPYPDGVSSRRTSVMAGLALGVPVVTNLGELTEPVWGTESNGIMLAAEPSSIAQSAEQLLTETPAERRLRGERERAWYASRFTIERTIEVLRGDYRS